MLDSRLSRSDDKHIRDGKIWAAVIIAVAALFLLSGLAAQLAIPYSWDAESGAIGEQVAASQAQAR